MYSVQMVWNFLLPAYALDDTNFYLHLTRFFILFIPTLQCISPLASWLRKLMEFCMLQRNLSYALLFYWTSHSETIKLKVQRTKPTSIKINKDKLNTGSAVQKMTSSLSSPTSTMTEHHSLCTSLRITSCRNETKNVVVTSNQDLTVCLMTRRCFILCGDRLVTYSMFHSSS